MIPQNLLRDLGGDNDEITFALRYISIIKMVSFYIERIAFRLVKKSERVARISDPYPEYLPSHRRFFGNSAFGIATAV